MTEDIAATLQARADAAEAELKQALIQRNQFNAAAQQMQIVAIGAEARLKELRELRELLAPPAAPTETPA